MLLYARHEQDACASKGNGGGGGTSGNNNPLYPSPTNPTPSDPNEPQEPGLVNQDGTGTIVSEPLFPVSMVRVLGLNLAQKAWWNDDANAEAVGIITEYLNENSVNGVIDSEARDFANWAVEYLRTHPNVTIEQFKNSYLGRSEGKDDFYDEEFWENPNLSFPQQSLPTWNDFENATLKNPDGTLMAGADAVCSNIGGAVWQARLDFPSKTQNTCALKISRALNYAGINIPAIITSPGNPGTLQGSDGKYYFLNAQALRKWMRETFGTNPGTSTTPANDNHFSLKSNDYTDGVIPVTSLAGIKGIYVMTPKNSVAFGASGHCDITNNTWCPFNCFLADAEEVEIWILEDE